MPETLEQRLARRKQVVASGTGTSLEERLAARKRASDPEAANEPANRPSLRDRLDEGARRRSDVVRQGARGLADAGTSTVRGIGWIGEKLGLRNDLDEWADRTDAETAEHYGEAETGYGTVARGAGRILGEGATLLAGGAGVGRGIAKVAEGAGRAGRAARPLARAIAAGRKGKFVQRVAAQTAPFAPFDVAMGAGGVDPEAATARRAEREAEREGREPGVMDRVADAMDPTTRAGGAALYGGLGLLGAGIIEGGVSGYRGFRSARRAKSAAQEAEDAARETIGRMYDEMEGAPKRLQSGAVVTPPPKADIPPAEQAAQGWRNLPDMEPMEGSPEWYRQRGETPPDVRARQEQRSTERANVQETAQANRQALRDAIREHEDALAQAARTRAEGRELTSEQQSALRALRARRGAAEAALLAHVASGGVGATAGTALNPDDPATGAAVGAGIGLGLPSVARAARRAAPAVRRRAAEALDPSIREELRGAHRAAETDDLTGVANARALKRALPSAEADADVAVTLFDANNFGQVNKIAGHEAGDRMLVEIADALNRAATEEGVAQRVFRKGGDEFVILAPKAKADQVRARATELFGERVVRNEAGESVAVSLSGNTGATFKDADAGLQAVKAARKAPAALTDDAALGRWEQIQREIDQAVESGDNEAYRRLAVERDALAPRARMLRSISPEPGSVAEAGQIEAVGSDLRDWTADRARTLGPDTRRAREFKPEVDAAIEANRPARAGMAAPALLAHVAGGGAGAATGAVANPDDPATGALTGAVLALGGVAAARQIGKRRLRPPIMERPGPQGARQPIGTPKQGRLFNKSLQSLDPEGRRMWEIEEAKLVEQGEVKRRVTDAEVNEFAKDVDVPNLTRSDASKLNTTELMALGTRIKEDRATYDALMTRMEREGATLSREAREELTAEMDAALGRLVGYDRVLNRAGSEQGRGLRILGKIAAQRGTLEAATHTARRVLGVPELGDDVTDALSKVMRDPTLASGNAREDALAKVIQGFQKQPLYRVILDVRRWSMLTAPATHAVNITGNIVEGINRNAIVTPTAAALDRAWSLITGASRSVSTRGRSTGLVGGIGKGARAIDRRYFQGIDPEDPLMALNRQRTDYVASLGLSERDGTEAWRQTLAAGARVLQKSGDVVYGMMTVPDKIFYGAALNASLMERSGLRAVREGLNPGTAAFKRRIVELMKPENVSTTDATMAVMEALDDVFKTPTKVGQLVRQAGPGAEWFVPYANTPTNLARKALESTPGVGLALNVAQVGKLRAKLAQLGVPAEDIAREVRRSRITNISKQLSTGVGMVAGGFVLTMMGRMTGDYVPPMGMDDEERDEASKRRLTGQGPLTIKVGNKAYSLNAFAQFAPLLAIGHALAMESKREAEAGDGNVVGRVAGRASLAAGRTIMDFPLLQGAKNATDFLSGERAGGFGRWAGREVASAIPYGAGVASIARATDPVAKRDPETFGEAIKERLPGLRQSVAPKVGPLGETTPRVGLVEGLISPGRPQSVRTGPLYTALEETGTYPSAAKKLEGETKHEYAARRQQEGEAERQLLQGILDGEDEAWAFLAPSARRQFEETGDWNRLLRSALSRQRTAVTKQRKLMAESP